MQIKAYRATTTQKHGGKVFLAGEIIPAECMPPFAAQKLLSIGIITETITESTTENNTSTFMFPYSNENGFENVDISVESLNFALKTLQINAEKANATVNECEDTECLNVLYALDSRKGVKANIEKRLKVLSGESDGDI